MACILGLNAYHGDSSAVIVCDGRVVAAAEEERFVRQKHWAGLPLESVRYCLEFAGIDFEEVEHVAINSDSRANRWKKLSHLLSGNSGVSLVLQKLRTRANRSSILESLSTQGGYPVSGARLHRVEHHKAHLASAYYPSEFESAALLSVDGLGDFNSAAWGRGRGGRIEVDGYVHFPHSLGIFYQAITQFLGFPQYGDEYKVMGLASYGQPRFSEEMKRVLAVDDAGRYQLDMKYFRHQRESLSWQWENGTPVWDALYSRELENLLGPARTAGEEISDRHSDIAASAQQAYENAFFSLLHALHRNTGESRLALAGGCAMNSVANGKILDRTPFDKVYVQPAAGDAGGAIGAALLVATEIDGGLSQTVMQDAYLGPGYDDDQIRNMLSANQGELSRQEIDFQWMDERALYPRVARALDKGAVVGWFQGRMEWGPRALGNRSILADPRRPDMQQLLNGKIKRREGFRPFSPSILKEHTAEWFETVDTVPFMEKVYPVKPDKAGLIPAVVHVDGSGRLQTVDEKSNPRFHRLISEFREITNIPILLNTSFNENEPIVCTPQQALDCFMRTRMDMLVLENACLVRNSP